MSTPNTWGNEHYHRPSQARPFYPPPPLPDDPGPTASEDKKTVRMTRVEWFSSAIGLVASGMIMGWALSHMMGSR